MKRNNVDKMFTYLRGYLNGANMQESMKALTFAKQCHEGQFRKDGETPYIVHPLSMACYAVALGIKEDSMISTILLHDICEDCNVSLKALTFSYEVKQGVKYMTVQSYHTDANKIETKRRYFNELLESREALICKGIDRYDNLSDMASEFDSDRIAKNLAETDVLLLPVLRKGKEKWPDLSNTLFIIRNNIKSLSYSLRHYHQEEYDKWFKIYKGEID